MRCKFIQEVVEELLCPFLCHITGGIQCSDVSMLTSGSTQSNHDFRSLTQTCQINAVPFSQPVCFEQFMVIAMACSHSYCVGLEYGAPLSIINCILFDFGLVLFHVLFCSDSIYHCRICTICDKFQLPAFIAEIVVVD